MHDSAYQVFCQIHESPGMAYLNRCKGRSFSLNIFEGNLKELKDCCNLIEMPENGQRLMSHEHRDAGIQVHRESMRLFHNFLASAKSLIDHTRVFVEDTYADTAIHSLYNEHMATTFATDHLSKFVNDLRNYMVHKGLPGCQMSFGMKNIGPGGQCVIESTVSLTKDDLLAWDRWHRLSREYLESSPSHIKLSSIAATYGDKVLSFYSWFDATLDEFHSKDLSELKKLQLQHAALEASGGET
jgi:hypothetical protein